MESIKEFEISQTQLKGKIESLEREINVAKEKMEENENSLAVLMEQKNTLRTTSLPPGFTVYGESFPSLMLRGEFVASRDCPEELFVMAWKMWDDAAKIMNVRSDKTPIAMRRKNDGLLFVLHEGYYRSVSDLGMSIHKTPLSAFDLKQFDRCYVED